MDCQLISVSTLFPHVAVELQVPYMITGMLQLIKLLFVSCFLMPHWPKQRYTAKTSHLNEIYVRAWTLKAMIHLGTLKSQPTTVFLQFML